MEIHETRDENGIRLAIIHALDLPNCPDLEKALDQRLDETTDPIWLDVAGLGTIDSAGLSLLLRVNRKAMAQNRRFAMVGTNSYHRKILEITRLCRELMVYDRPGGQRLDAVTGLPMNEEQVVDEEQLELLTDWEDLDDLDDPSTEHLRGD